MKRKFLYALALLLSVSSVAFSKDCARHWCRTSGKLHEPAAVRTRAGATAEPAMAQEDHLFLHTFIKILYI